MTSICPGALPPPTLIGSRVTYTMTLFMFTSTPLQYNSDARNLSANVRLRWDYQPGSERFVVYNEDRDTLTRGLPSRFVFRFVFEVVRLRRPIRSRRPATFCYAASAS